MKTIQFDDGKIGIVNEPTYEVIVRLDEKGKVYEYVGDLVRCKDCKHFRQGDMSMVEQPWYCESWENVTDIDGYCSFGEVKDNE